MIQNHIGSSETTRESPFYNFDFACYIKYHRPVASLGRGPINTASLYLTPTHNHKCKEDFYTTTHFLEWFLG